MLGVSLVRTLRSGLHLLETEVEDFDVRAAVLVGTERAVVFDTLAHPSQMTPVEDLVGGLPVTVVYSHADWDHAWGTARLADVTEVVAHEHAAVRFGTDVPRELAGRVAADAERWADVALIPPTVTFQDHHQVELGGVTLLLSALPGHTPDSIVGLVPQWGLLLAADAVETPLPVVNDRDAVAGWMEGLRRWLGDDRVETVVPSHGPVGGRERVASTLSYLEALVEGGTWPGERGPLPRFYATTHRRNVELVRGTGASGGS